MPKQIQVTVSNTEYFKLVRMKKADGFEGRDWGAWLAFVARDVRKPNMITESTMKNMLPMWCSNFAQNMGEMLKGETLSTLVPEHPEQVPKGPCVVVGAGPSIWMHKHLDMLADAIKSGRYKGIVSASDRMLKPLLERGIVPDLTGTVDGSPIIKKWYDGPLVRKYGPQIKTCLNSNVSIEVTKACKRNKVHVLWFNGLQDDMLRLDTFSHLQKMMTRSPQNPNGLVAVTCGGNVGYTIWSISLSILRRSPIALIGIDMGYPEGTQLQTTPYFSNYIEGATATYGPERSDIACRPFKKVYNPCIKKYAYLDDIFTQYRLVWLKAAKLAPPYVQTINCSEEGTLFGPRITCMPFAEFLKSVES
jgi:hypothetical protein